MRSIPLVLSIPGDSARETRTVEPVVAGVPLPRGYAPRDGVWQLRSAVGGQLPVDTRVTECWPDGTARWLVVDTRIAASAASAELALELTPATAGARSSLIRDRDHQGMRIDTGICVYGLSTAAPMLLSDVLAGDRRLVNCQESELRLRGEGGEPWTVRWQGLDVEHDGALRAAVLAVGEATAPDGRSLSTFLRLEFFAQVPAVRVRLTVRNPHRADHPGGIWELGDKGSILLRELSLTISPATPGAHVTWSVEPGHTATSPERVSIYQESSGGTNWQSTNHVDRSGTVPLRFRGYRVEAAAAAGESLRATPVVITGGEGSAIGAAVPRFWQNFPRGLEASPGGIRVSFFPEQFPTAHEIQGGEQKTHECFLAFAPDLDPAALDWCRTRAVLHPPPSWYAAAEAAPYLVPATADDPRFRALADAAVDGPDTFVHKRERADEYGWRHFGDIYGDHEAVFSPDTPLMSHYNNQYDPIAGLHYQFMRTGDVRWWSHCEQLAAHVVDIDLYHTGDDKSAYNHGLFWHTYHYVDAGKANHRSYPTGTVGGGPSSEQNYPTGLMLHYFATGDTASRDAAMGLAQFVIDIDDGTRTVFRWLDRGYTGIASASRSFDYHGPGRGSGNSLNALLDGHRLSGERRFLDKAEQIIRRCTHPEQDIEALTLLDPENRWFYTMYLQALGKYLDRKAEIEELDDMYAYGQAVLLHFARWMAVHEVPYLDRPEVLEYPTETWAAQDIRKSEIFDAAARHAAGQERERFLERAAFFFNYCVTALAAMPTRSLARPVVLLIAHGHRRAHATHQGVVPAPAATAAWKQRWPKPEVFVPQKARALRRAKAIVSAGAIAGALGAATLLWFLI